MSCTQRSKGKGERQSKGQTPQEYNYLLSVKRGKCEEMQQNGVSQHPLDMAAAPEPKLLCIFGTGDLGRSLGLRLLQSGYGVVCGSRRPHSCGPLPQGAQVMTHAEAAQSSNLIFICVHREHYGFLTKLEHHLKGKVLVDLSNNLKKGIYPESNAAYLQRLVPSAAVVKGLNTLSAWALQNGLLAGKLVFLCGESGEAKQAVAHLATKLGLTVLDKGSLSAARELEDFPLKLFPEWRLPLSIAVGLTAFFFFYLLIKDVIYAYVKKKDDISYRIMLSLANKVFPIVALVMLSLCYLPGEIAAFFQLFGGTKYRRFPNWLDRWMLCRKQMGLVALGYAFLHAIYSFIIPIRYSERHKLISGVVDEVQQAGPNQFDNTGAWGTDSFISLGILGFFLFVLLGLTSLPSVGGSLSWREFNFIQSNLGHLTLFICTAHGYIYGWNKFIKASTYKWYTPPGYMLCLIVPSVVLLLKLLLLLREDKAGNADGHSGV
ncbi:metalloreductase STEAP4-like [Poeciliopsis prolifica]|uniref:metalloreductase STEAP4-like n=1 Tax=Poeciliopsis prolifica TaxID=188132 RepID=UPI0024137D16|nr:metalloreductase STEAP4-like [Poeciliopsis prolifica]